MCRQIFLTIPITNFSSELSFSPLKRIKIRLRSILNQPNLNAQGILTIESDIRVLTMLLTTFQSGK